MKLNDIIRTRRQALGLTQEQLAQKLGVSAPAVNKWERALNYPDITLLPALARTLGVDLNTLLSFQEELTEEEIGEFLNQLYAVSQTGGSGAAFALAEDKLREYPNSDQLAYSVAGILAGILALLFLNSFGGFLGLTAVANPFSAVLTGFLGWNLYHLFVENKGNYGGYPMYALVVAGWAVTVLVLISGFLIRPLINYLKKYKGYVEPDQTWDSADLLGDRQEEELLH